MNLRCTHKQLSKSPGLKWALTLQDSFYTVVSPSHYISIIPHIVKYRGNKRPSLCKNVLQTTYIACTAGLKSAPLVKQTAVSEIQPVRPICHGILFCFVLCKKYLPCRLLHNGSSHSEYSCTVVMAHKPGWICIPQEGLFFIVSALLFCFWLEQAAVPGVILGPLPIAVSDVNTFLNVWLLALFPNRFKKNPPCTILWFVW